MTPPQSPAVGVQRTRPGHGQETAQTPRDACWIGVVEGLRPRGRRSHLRRPHSGPGPGSSDREHRRLIGRPSRRWKIPAATRAYLPDPRMDWTGRRPRLPRRLRQHPHSKLLGPKPFQDVKTAEGVEIRVVVDDRKAWLTSTASPPPTTRPATASSSSTSPRPNPARDHGLRLATPHSTPDHRTTCKQLPSAAPLHSRMLVVRVRPGHGEC
jgi:hypothetical protein